MIVFPVGQGKEGQMSPQQKKVIKNVMTYTIHLVMSKVRVIEDDQCSPIEQGPHSEGSLVLYGLYLLDSLFYLTL